MQKDFNAVTSLIEVDDDKKEKTQKVKKILKTETLKKDTLLNKRYQVVEQITHGNPTSIYKAYDVIKKMPVAIKVFQNNKFTSKRMLVRWEREKLIMKLWMNNHTTNVANHLVTIYEIFTEGEYEFIAMEWLNNSLKDVVKEKGKIPTDLALDYFYNIVKGIQMLHKWEYKILSIENLMYDKGIIHRDIKPQNVLFDTYGNPKIVDFGIGIFKDYRVDKEVTRNIIRELNIDEFDLENPVITREGYVVGSVQYIDLMALHPKNSRATIKTDIYSLGIMFYEMLTGLLPFDGDRVTDIAAQHFTKTIPLVSEHGVLVPNSYENLITRCTAKGADFGLRYESTEELLQDIENIINNHPYQKLLVSARSSVETTFKKYHYDIEIEKEKEPIYLTRWFILSGWGLLLGLIGFIIAYSL